ncbi:MAG: ATPase, T2SS/T4P/T4SS family [Candidatus Xenobia bacterium]
MPSILKNRYEVLGILLDCRFSILYRGQDHETGKSCVVRHLKTPPSNVDQTLVQSVREQFNREGHLLSTLIHRGIPRVTDCFEETGHLFLITDPFEGTTLKEVAASLAGPPGEKLLTRWLTQLTDIFVYLHGQAEPVVYRDLRPDSAFVTPEAVVMLVDFGMARLVESVSKRGTLLKLMGDLSYGAPEQFTNAPTDAKVDLYALGATIYGLASGAPPPSAWDRYTQGVELVSLKVKNPAISEGFSNLIQSLMALDARQRPQNASEVLDYLEHLKAERGSLPPLPPVSPAGPMADAVLPPLPPLEAPVPEQPEAAPAAVAVAEKMEEKALDNAMPSATDEVFVDLANIPLERTIARALPEAAARLLKGVCIGTSATGNMLVAVKDPVDAASTGSLSQLSQTGWTPTVLKADAALIDLAQEFIYTGSASNWLEWLHEKQYKTEHETLVEAPTSAPPTPDAEGVEKLLADALARSASDVHLETDRDEIVLRCRIDGVLHVLDTWPREQGQSFINRIKTLAGIEQERSARKRLELKDQSVHLRISAVNVPDGESIVLHVLERGGAVWRLDDLGFTERNLAAIRRIIHRPFGLVLVVGRAASGRSTMQYAALTDLNSRERKIVTVEEDMAYRLHGATQVNVNGQSYLTSLDEGLMQDPDVLLIGDVSGERAARQSMLAAQSGRLVLGALTSSSAIGAVGQLSRIDPFLLGNTLIGCVAQVLVRRTCMECRQPVTVSPQLMDLLHREGHGTPTLYKAVGCTACHDTGYHGRLGIHEVLEVTPALGAMIAASASPADLLPAAQRAGFHPLAHDALEKLAQGFVSVEELQRVGLDITT